MRQSRGAVAVVAAIACLAACGSATRTAAPSASRTPSSAASKRSHPDPTPTPTPQPGQNPGCGGPIPPRQAWAQAVSSDGKKLWSTKLHVGQSGFESLAPLVALGELIAAQDGMVTALDERTGRVRWTWPGGRAVYGMWLSGSTVVVLTDQVGSQAHFSALRLTDGSVAWRDAIAGDGILGNVVATSNGGLAWVRADGAVQMMRTSDGKILWSHAGSRSPALIDIDGRVLFAASGTVKAYDETTGSLDWTASGMPAYPQLTAAARRALVSSGVSGGSSPTAVIALDPATGSQAWRFDNGQTESFLGSDQTGILLASGPFSYQLRLIDTDTGRQTWQANVTVQSLDSLALLTNDLVINGEGGTAASPRTYLVARSRQTGDAVWTVPLTGYLIGTRPIMEVGPLIITQLPPRGHTTASTLAAYQSSNGHLAWSVPAPTFIQAPVAVDGKTIFVQSADPAYACATRT